MSLYGDLKDRLEDEREAEEGDGVSSHRANKRAEHLAEAGEPDHSWAGDNVTSAYQ